MENYLKEIKKKIETQIVLEEIIVINNSDRHKKHKFFDKNKFHIQLDISSKYLKSLSRINAQKLIMNILKYDLKNKIHALEINIK
tara:strand:+ start:679 stop:933 length:255 start_codon:yes stop_codon:yes gene_type:complete